MRSNLIRSGTNMVKPLLIILSVTAYAEERRPCASCQVSVRDKLSDSMIEAENWSLSFSVAERPIVAITPRVWHYEVVSIRARKLLNEELGRFCNKSVCSVVCHGHIIPTLARVCQVPAKRT